MNHDKKKNIMLILSSPSGVGKTTLTKKCNKNIKILNFLYLTQQENLGPTRLMVLIIILTQVKSLQKLIVKNKFYEYAKIYENFYGTSKKKCR